MSVKKLFLVVNMIKLLYILHISKKESIIFITHPSSTGEFLNTITHEANHLKSHIASYYGLDEKDEEVCYIIGDIVQQMSETFMRFIYSKCLKIKN